MPNNSIDDIQRLLAQGSREPGPEQEDDIELELGFEEEADIGFSEGDGQSELPEEEDLSLADDDDDGELELLEDDLTEVYDVTAICMDYYNALQILLEKGMPRETVSSEVFHIERTDFPYLDKRYIPALIEAISTLAKEQAALEPSERMSVSDCADTVYEQLRDTTGLILGVHEDAFLEMCERKYENFLQLSCAVVEDAKPRFSNFIDLDRVRESHRIFELTGLTWQYVTAYVTDSNVPDFTVTVQGHRMVATLGPAMRAYIEAKRSLENPQAITVRGYDGQLTVNTDLITVKDLKGCIDYALDDLFRQEFQLTDSLTKLPSEGECLRRYVMRDFESGDLDVSLLMDYLKNAGWELEPTLDCIFRASSSNENDRNIIYAFLNYFFFSSNPNQNAVGTESIALELIHYIGLLLYAKVFSATKDNTRLHAVNEYYNYLIRIMRVFVALGTNSPYVHLAMYSSLSPITTDGGTEFYLEFVEKQFAYRVRTSNPLVGAVGDQRQVFLVPTAEPILANSQNVTPVGAAAPECPPCTVIPFAGLFQDLQYTLERSESTGRKSTIEGVAEYLCSPSLKWIMNRSYSSQDSIDALQVGEQHVERTSDPFLRTLISYTNDFADEVFPTDAKEVTVKESGIKALYIEENHGFEGTKVQLVSVVKDGYPISNKGSVEIGVEDDGLFLQYFVGEGFDEEDKVIIVPKGDYDLAVCQLDRSSDNKVPLAGIIRTTPAPSDFLCGGPSLPVLTAMNKKLCVLNALDYEEELEEARLVVMRDLKNVMMTYYLDNLLASRLLNDFVSEMKKDGFIDTTNFETLHALILIVSGSAPNFEGKDAWDDACQEDVDKALRETTSLSDMCTYINHTEDFDYNVLALQGLASSACSNRYDPERYMALHAIPALHERLSHLEERILLLRVLNEIGSDIVPVLRKKSAVLKAYNDITTADTLESVATAVQNSMKYPKRTTPFPLTSRVLSAEVGGSTPILKFFALERNVYGILSTAGYSIDESEKKLFDSLSGNLGLDADGIPKMLAMNEQAFMRAPFAMSTDEACFRNRSEIINLVHRGLLAETNTRDDLRVIKAYDLLMTYGAALLDIVLPSTDDENTAKPELLEEYKDDLYSYTGSFLVSYCYLRDEALVGAGSAPDRATLFREDSSGFTHDIDLGFFSRYSLNDMRMVAN